MEACSSKVYGIREPQNPAMVWVGKDLTEHLVPISCCGLREKGVCANTVTPREGNSLRTEWPCGDKDGVSAWPEV